MKKKNKITVVDNSSGKKFEFEIKDGSNGPSVVDFTDFYAKTGLFVYDPGFNSTASCQSQITYIDGDKGHLLHRGYSIEDLAKYSDYPEVCYLLLNGELPSLHQKKILVTYLHIIQCFMNKFRGFTLDLGETLIQWQ